MQTKVISYSSNPDSFISEVIDEAKTILSTSSSSEEKAQKLSEIAIKTVDIKGVKLNPIDFTFSFSSLKKINYFITAIKE